MRSPLLSETQANHFPSNGPHGRSHEFHHPQRMDSVSCGTGTPFRAEDSRTICGSRIFSSTCGLVEKLTRSTKSRNSCQGRNLQAEDLVPERVQVSMAAKPTTSKSAALIPVSIDIAMKLSRQGCSPARCQARRRGRSLTLTRTGIVAHLETPLVTFDIFNLTRGCAAPRTGTR